VGSLTNGLSKLYNRIARMRSDLNRTEDRLRELREAFDHDTLVLHNSINDMRVQIEADENSLKKAILEDNLKSGLKKFPGGIEVKEFTIPDYDEATALKWAREAGVCIKLDKTAFEKLAKSNALPFVSFHKELRVQLPTKMEPVLGVEP
jgi:hypothetical protein